MKKLTIIAAVVFATTLTAIAGENTVTVMVAPGQNDAAMAKNDKPASEETGLAAHKKLAVQYKKGRYTPIYKTNNVHNQKSTERSKNTNAEQLKMGR